MATRIRQKAEKRNAAQKYAHATAKYVRMSSSKIAYILDLIRGKKAQEAVAILENVKNKIAEYKKNGDEIIFTRDTHQDDYMTTNEGKHLPVVHCIEGTPGWEIYEGLYEDG